MFDLSIEYDNNILMKTIIMKMTDAYEYQCFYEKIDDLNVVDCRNISGTRCYLDVEAKHQLLEKISAFDYHGIHFIDSGNYHYLSLLWLMKVDVDFNLILFDHHPDNQPPSFGEITSCGGWVLEASDVLSHLKNVYTFGVGEEISVGDIPADLPIYISIDKDILGPAYAITDWDQGSMTLDEMKALLEELLAHHNILGVDICGDAGENSENATVINDTTNEILLDFLTNILSL